MIRVSLKSGRLCRTHVCLIRFFFSLFSNSSRSSSQSPIALWNIIILACRSTETFGIFGKLIWSFDECVCRSCSFQTKKSRRVMSVPILLWCQCQCARVCVILLFNEYLWETPCISQNLLCHIKTWTIVWSYETTHRMFRCSASWAYISCSILSYELKNLIHVKSHFFDTHSCETFFRKTSFRIILRKEIRLIHDRYVTINMILEFSLARTAVDNRLLKVSL